MSKFFYKGGRTNMSDTRSVGYKTKKVLRPGTETNPARVIVQTAQRSSELQALAKANDIIIEVVIDEEKPEYTVELDTLLQKTATQVKEKTPSRNDPCICNSGKKYKKCCGA